MDFVLGTAVKINVVIDDASPTAVTITIEDPNDTAKVLDAAMTKETDKVYYYIWQSKDDDTDEAGTYEAIIKVTKGTYTSVAYQTFDMIEVSDN